MKETSDTRFDRPDDSGYNNPSKSPEQTRPLSETESGEFVRSTWDEDLSAYSSASGDRQIPSPVSVLEKAHRFIRKSIFALILGFLVIGLLIYATALEFITNVAAYPIYLQLPVWLLLALVLVIVLYSLVRFLKIWSSLQSRPKVTLHKVDSSDRAKAQDELIKYLKKLNVKKRHQALNWSKFWPDDSDQVSTLVKACTDLTTTRPIDTDTWHEEFNAKFLNPIDQAANRRIRYYSQLVGIKTAVSPFPLIDSLAVIYNNFLLLGDLASLYGRKLNRKDLFLLLWMNIFQVYIASQSQEFLDTLADEMTKTIQSQIARSFTQLIAPKVAEGTINAMVTWRLGKQAMKIMHPVKQG